MRGDVSAAYDRWAAVYDGDENRTRDLAGEALRAQRFALQGQTVVEVGCGTGRNTEWLATDARRVVATDVSRGMLAKARARVRQPNVCFLEHDAREPWPFETSTADLVIETLVLEHVERLEPFFDEASRVLRPGGELYLAELHPARQLAGRRAEFVDPATGERVRVAAFLHDTSDVVNGALCAGFELIELGELRDAGADARDLPRLLTARLRRR